MPGQLQDRDRAQVDLLRPRQRQQKVQRPLEPIDIDDQRLGGQTFGNRVRIGVTDRAFDEVVCKFVGHARPLRT